MKVALYIWPLFLVCGLAERRRYDGYQVWKVTVNSMQEARFLWDLEAKGIVDIGGSLKRGNPVSLTVSARHTRSLAETFFKKNIPFTSIIDNIQNLIDEEWRRLDDRKDAGVMAYDPNDFNTLDDNYNHMIEVVNNCTAPLVCSYFNAGNSYEGRPIYIFQVGTSTNFTSKPVVWVDSTIHAREWLTTTTNVKIFDYMLSQYSLDLDATDLLNRFDFYFLPIGNPDGYQYSWDVERLWRKNRHPFGNCVGTDLNRNFDFNWCLQGASTDPCAENYCGPAPVSEPETMAYENAIMDAASRMFTLVTLHSRGSMWMFPWGNTADFTDNTTCVMPVDFDNLNSAAAAACSAIYSASGVWWAYGTSCEVIYPTTGATDDWAKGAVDVAYSYNPELRGDSPIAEVSDIEASFVEVWRGLSHLIREIQQIEGPDYP